MSTDPAGLERLIRRARRLETEALCELSALYAPRIYGMQFRLTGSREAAEDLMQETFLRMVRTISVYRHEGRFDAWLFRIAANLGRDYLRQLRRRGAAVSLDALEHDEGVSGDSAAADGGLDAEEVVISDETRERLQGALLKLPEMDREVILLRHYAEMSFQNIAEMLEIPLGTALARAHRALKRLRLLLKNQD